VSVSRRQFLATSGVGAAVALAPAVVSANDLLAVGDEGWRLWIDQAATWKDDVLHLPSAVDLKTLPINPPTGGWARLGSPDGLTVDLPTTVEQHLWGKFGTRPYGADEYRYAEDDDVPPYGAYKGVSWWSKSIDIPAAAKGKRVMLNLRGARLRAEVFLNEQLVGYSIMSELPFSCDLTQAMRPGEPNRLAIRITNPGGRYRLARQHHHDLGQGEAVRLARLRRSGSRPDPDRPSAFGADRGRLGAEHAGAAPCHRLHGSDARQADGAGQVDRLARQGEPRTGRRSHGRSCAG
jgi:hypothetical protein